MPNYKITLEYDGTNYVGWQRQENGPSVQQFVEEAIEKLSKQKITPVSYTHLTLPTKRIV